MFSGDFKKNKMETNRGVMYWPNGQIREIFGRKFLEDGTRMVPVAERIPQHVGWIIQP